MVAPMASPEDMAAAYWRDGYAIVRGLFPPDEIAALGEVADRVLAEGVTHARSYRHGNLFYKIVEGTDGKPRMPMAQWASWAFPELDAVRTHPRYVAVLGPLIGRDLKQIIHQLHWKTPGAPGDFAWHQDSRFRKPDEAYRNLGGSYVQTGLAIDRHDSLSGCMRFIPRSHARGDLDLDTHTEVLGTAMVDAPLANAGLDPRTAVDLVLEPGDLALWNPYLVHGSGPNRSDHQRRLLINGYVRAEDCDRGEWAFRNGEPVPLPAEPSLVHFEELHDYPEAYYP